MKQHEVAKFVSVDASMISKYEQGVNFPDYPVLIKLAECFDTSVDYLLGRTNIKTAVERLEANLQAQGGAIPIDLLFQLEEEDRELVRLLLKSISEKPAYQQAKQRKRK